MANQARNGEEERLPALLPWAPQADYFRQVALAGGSAYKTLSYELLDVKPGMRVLDVGCGMGGDLPALADRVGPAGMVVGIEPDWDLLQEAQAASSGRENILVA